MFTDTFIPTLFTYTEDTGTLTDVEEAALIKAAQGGDESATLGLLTAYGPVLRSTVSRFVSRLPEPERTEDIIEETRMEAVAAVLQVIQQHDADKSPRLAGRIVPRLTAALAEAARQDAHFTVPERTLSRFYGILREADGDIEAARDLAPAMGMTTGTFDEVRRAVRETLSLTHADHYEEDDSEGDRLLAFPLHSGIRSAYDEAEDALMVEVAFKAVDDEEARIIEMAYGFTEFDPVPDAEIAHRVGGTRPTIQRKRGKALGKMRKALGVTHGEQK